jgi:hypothetical protein
MRIWSGFIWLMLGPSGERDCCHTSSLHKNNQKKHVISRDTINCPKEVVPDGEKIVPDGES